MAIEYQRGKHYFAEPDDSAMALPDASWFQYNFLHDLESVLWMYAWFIITTLPDCLHADGDTADLRQAILAFRDELFDGGTSDHLEFLTRFPEGHAKAKDLLFPLYEKADRFGAWELLDFSCDITRRCNAQSQLSERAQCHIGIPHTSSIAIILSSTTRSCLFTTR